MKRCCTLIMAAIAVLVFNSCSSYVQKTPPVRERIEWYNIWITNADSDTLPRVLFIGDSITQGYFGPVEKLIGNRANCARITTSGSVCDPIYFDELSLILEQYEFAVIHFNNGLHGWGYSEDKYREGIERLIDLLKDKAPRAKLIWASSTPVLRHAGMSVNAHRVPVRNGIASGLAESEGIPVNDLYSLVEGHDSYYSKDGVHFNDEGKSTQAEQVAKTVLMLLEQ